MLSYYLKCRKNAEIKKSKVTKTINRRIILSSKCALCEQKPSGISNSLGTKTS